MEIVLVERSAVSGINTVRVTLDGERYVDSYPRTDSALSTHAACASGPAGSSVDP